MHGRLLQTYHGLPRKSKAGGDKQAKDRPSWWSLAAKKLLAAHMRLCGWIQYSCRDTLRPGVEGCACIRLEEVFPYHNKIPQMLVSRAPSLTWRQALRKARKRRMAQRSRPVLLSPATSFSNAQPIPNSARHDVESPRDVSRNGANCKSPRPESPCVPSEPEARVGMV